MSHHFDSRPDREPTQSYKHSHHAQPYKSSHHAGAFKHHDHSAISSHPHGDGSLGSMLFGPGEHNIWKELFSHKPGATDNGKRSKGTTANETGAAHKNAGQPEGLLGKVFGGLMSWYSDPQKMANGHQFDARKYTVAHKTLPLGTILDISAHGKTVRAEVTDRGPYVKKDPNRTLDVSLAIARDLGFVDKGKTDYTATVVSVGDNNYYSSPRHRQQHKHYHV